MIAPMDSPESFAETPEREAARRAARLLHRLADMVEAKKYIPAPALDHITRLVTTGYMIGVMPHPCEIVKRLRTDEFVDTPAGFAAYCRWLAEFAEQRASGAAREGGLPA